LRIALATQKARGGPAEPVLRLQLPLAGVTLTGSIDARFQAARVEHGYSSSGPKQLVKLGVKHLAMCAAGAPSPSVAVLRGQKQQSVDTIRLNPLGPDLARARLETLIHWFAKGQALPLPFLPVPSQAYFLALRGKKPEEALDKAIKAYAESNRTGIVDQHVERIFRGLMPPFDSAYDQGCKSLEETHFHAASLAFFDCFQDLLGAHES
ncbi:MAG TPA: hypothetical protein VFQ61_35315, partial [Polyangiaceae bacterium]|nr:hypothetical protein [Polyangiaceae bacterium]